MNVFTHTGARLPFVMGALNPGETQIWEYTVVLGSDQASHFTIGSQEYASTNLKVSIAYGLKSGDGSRAYFPESSKIAHSWRLFTGDWAKVYDAVSIINFGEQPATIKIKHRALDGRLIQEMTLIENALPLSKTLYRIGGPDSEFNYTISPVFEIESNQPIGMFALQGDLEGSKCIWQNPIRELR